MSLRTPPNDGPPQSPDYALLRSLDSSVKDMDHTQDVLQPFTAISANRLRIQGELETIIKATEALCEGRNERGWPGLDKDAVNETIEAMDELAASCTSNIPNHVATVLMGRIYKAVSRSFLLRCAPAPARD